MNRVRVVSCPTCLRQLSWDTTNPYRPFCSERCKLLDLGDWASGKHAIPGESVSDYEDPDPNTGSQDDYLESL
jgi:endogenous inhibitor of DNA gyrase (YacG/DUF329 family)